MNSCMVPVSYTHLDVYKRQIIHQTLKKAKAALKAGKKTIAEIEIESFNLLKSIANFKPEYFAIRDAISLKKVNEKHKEQKVILVACWVGEVRLIDNILI